MKVWKTFSSYFVENELVINLKAGKTECMLLLTVPNLLILFYNDNQIYVAESYKYLDAIINLWT